MARAHQIGLVVGILLAPSVAFAHGEEIFITFGVQLLAVVACLIASIVFLKAWGYRVFAMLGSLLGVILSWSVTGNWPYLSNRTEITALDVSLPFLGTMLVIVFVKVLPHDKRVS